LERRFASRLSSELPGSKENPKSDLIDFVKKVFCLLVAIYLGAVCWGNLRLIPHFNPILQFSKCLEVSATGLFVNGSVAEFGGKRWVALRKIEGKKSFIYVTEEKDGVCVAPFKLDLQTEHAEDPRLIVFQEQLVVVYNDLIGVNRRMHLAFLKENGTVAKIQLLLKEGPLLKTEKNWVPFIHEKQLYFIYKASPWTILEWQPDGICRLTAETAISIPTQYGSLSGGTPAIRVGDEYISFFHHRFGSTRSYASWNRYIYLIGAYTFEASPPFRLKKVTSAPLSYPGAYNLFTNPKKILYPAGLLETADALLLSVGVNDERTELLLLSKAAFLEVLESRSLSKPELSFLTDCK